MLRTRNQLLLSQHFMADFRIHILKRRRSETIVQQQYELHSSPGSAGIQIYKDPGSRLVFFRHLLYYSFQRIIS